jgi:hypothetical protein
MRFMIFNIVTLHQISFGFSNREERDRHGMWHEWGQERCIEDFGGETGRKETTWKTLTQIR